MSNRTIKLSRAQIGTITQDPQAIKFFEGLQPGPLENADVLTLGASPATYLAGRDGTLVVLGGTVSDISYVRNETSIPLGITSGLIPVLMADAIVITYTIAPVVTFLPS